MNKFRSHLNNAVIGTTSTGKKIYKTPELNKCFNSKEHKEAYLAHTRAITYGSMDVIQTQFHKRAMDTHYLLAQAA